MGASRTPDELADRAWLRGIAARAIDQRGTHRATVLWVSAANTMQDNFRVWCGGCTAYLTRECTNKAALTRLAREHERSWRDHERSVA